MSPDPLFYLVASVAVICFGLAKGGFVGIGFLATPLLALVVPPMQAVTTLLPIMLVQDAVSVWAYPKPGTAETCWCCCLASWSASASRGSSSPASPSSRTFAS